MPTVTICDLEDDVTSYNLSIRVRIISVFDDPSWNKRMGMLLGPTVADSEFFVVDLDPGEYDIDGVGDRVKVKGKNFEIVGKHEQRKALLTLLENSEYRYSVLKTMVNSGCSITSNYPDLDNGTALFFTAFSGIKEATKVLLKLGADPNVINDNGWSAVMIAASQGKSNAMRILIEGGADMEVKNDAGWTALLVAANAGKPKAVKMLLLMGADPNAKNNYGKNAYDLASDEGHNEVMNVMLKHGVGPSEDKVMAGDARKLLPSLGRGSEEGKGQRRRRRVGRRRSFAGMSSAIPLYMQDEENSQESTPSKNISQKLHTPSPNKSILPPLSNSPNNASSVASNSPAAVVSPAPSSLYVDPKQLQLALQNGWSKSIDEISGHEYFYHVDGRSSWTVPVNDGTWVLPGTEDPAPYNPDEDVYKGPKDSVTGETFKALALSKKKKDDERRAPESKRVMEIRERKERRSSIQYIRQRNEIERLAFMEEGERHKKKAIDKDKYLGNYTKDKTRRRSF